MFDISKIPTYQANVYQSRANRTFKRLKNKILRKYGLSLTQWTVLGFIYEGGREGVRTSDLAASLNTSQAFITNAVNGLEDKGLVRRTDHSTDARAKMVMLAPGQRTFVKKIESSLRKELRETVYSKISRKDLNTYVKVLKEFAE